MRILVVSMALALAATPATRFASSTRVTSGFSLST